MKEYDVAFREKITVKVRVWDNTGITITVKYSVGKWLSLSKMAVFFNTLKVAEHSFAGCEYMSFAKSWQ